MEKTTVKTSVAPEVWIGDVMGDLLVKGWDRSEVAFEANPEDFSMEEQDDVVRLSCQSDLELRLPHAASLKVKSAHGEASFKLVHDSVEIGVVHGSLSLRNMGAVQVESVHGELFAKELGGDLQVGEVHGNVDLREVHGSCHMETVHGNLDARNIDGDIQMNVQGNARLRLRALDGADYQVQADGNLQCRIPDDANVQLSLSSEAELIKIKLPGRKDTLREASCELTLGEADTRDGQAHMELSAGGTLHLSSQQVEWDDLDEPDIDLDDNLDEQISQQVESQIQAQMASMMAQINKEMARLSEEIGRAGLSAEQSERIMEHARQTSEREAARAQEKVRHAQEKLERKLEASRRKQEARQRSRQTDRRTRGWGFEWPSPPMPPTPPMPPSSPTSPRSPASNVSDDERLMILRMLEQKKISLDEAEQLLAALEGKG